MTCDHINIISHLAYFLVQYTITVAAASALITYEIMKAVHD